MGWQTLWSQPDYFVCHARSRLAEHCCCRPFCGRAARLNLIASVDDLVELVSVCHLKPGNATRLCEHRLADDYKRRSTLNEGLRKGIPRRERLAKLAHLSGRPSCRLGIAHPCARVRESTERRQKNVRRDRSRYDSNECRARCTKVSSIKERLANILKDGGLVDRIAQREFVDTPSIKKRALDIATGASGNR